MTPRVSVLIPVFNGARWLGDALGSVARQTFADFECLAIDDGSTDDSVKILRGWAGRDRRIRLIEREHRGLVEALNHGIQEARGPYLARLDADDRASPERLQSQVRFLDGNPDCGLVGTWAEALDERGRRQRVLKPATKSDDLVVALSRTNPFVHSSVMMRTDLARRLGGYRAPFEAAEDYDLWLRMSEAMTIANLPLVLTSYRRRSDNVSGSKPMRQAFSARLAQRAAQARRATGRDPANDLSGPPDWWVPIRSDAFFASDVPIYRLLDWARSPDDPGGDHVDFTPLVERFAELSHAERDLAIGAISDHARRNAGPAAVRSRRLLLRLVARRPGALLSVLRGAIRQ